MWYDDAIRIGVEGMLDVCSPRPSITNNHMAVEVLLPFEAPVAHATDENSGAVPVDVSSNVDTCAFQGWQRATLLALNQMPFLVLEL